MQVTRYIRQHHIGLVALFVALTGTAYAGTQVANRPAEPQLLKAKKRKKARPIPGPAGPAGPQGPRGDTGLQGDPGISGYLQVNAFSAGDSSQEQSATATCPQGTKVIGGGAVINTGGSRVDLAVTSSIPISDGSGWGASGVETTAHVGTWAVNARAICANVAP